MTDVDAIKKLADEVHALMERVHRSEIKDVQLQSSLDGVKLKMDDIQKVMERGQAQALFYQRAFAGAIIAGFAAWLLKGGLYVPIP